jgi:hypothetical protein
MQMRDAVTKKLFQHKDRKQHDSLPSCPCPSILQLTRRPLGLNTIPSASHGEGSPIKQDHPNSVKADDSHSQHRTIKSRLAFASLSQVSHRCCTARHPPDRRVCSHPGPLPQRLRQGSSHHLRTLWRCAKHMHACT